MGTNNGVESKLKSLVPNLFTNASKFSIPEGIDKFTKDINYHVCYSSTEEATSPNIKNILVLIFT